MSFYPANPRSQEPLMTWEKDRHTPGFGMEAIANNQGAERATKNIDKAEARSGAPCRGPFKQKPDQR